MENLLNLFLTQIKIKGSEKTSEDYERHIRKFFEKVNKDVKDVNYEDLINYYNTEFANVKVNSKRTYMSAILSFFKFLYEQNVIDSDITKSFKLPKAEIKDMDYLNQEEAQEVAKLCESESRNPYRKKAMFVMLVNTGMRASELANLKLYDIGDEWINVCNAKGNKFRRIPLHPSVKKAVEDYVKYERGYTKQPYLFVNQWGNKLSHDNIGRDLARVMAKSNINKHISAHRLRDSFATIQYTNGTDFKNIQETMGHSSIQMTLHYIQKVDDMRKNQVIGSGVNF
jgi:site-specific recombinase XerD